MKSNDMILGLLAVIAGVLVLAWHDALQWTVGIFLIVWGLFHLLSKKH
ncbi:MAG: DUF3096 domain-containing protein [Dehalococcoidaceae bacterium]|nr:DUF3096 domain-containing protein [Dehalococcoidaceae bacterium]